MLRGLGPEQRDAVKRLVRGAAEVASALGRPVEEVVEELLAERGPRRPRDGARTVRRRESGALVVMQRPA